METKDGFVLFFSLLSVLLFGCLAFSTLHNASQIAQLQQQLQQISDQCNNDHGNYVQASQQDILTKLISEVDEMVSNKDQDIKSFNHQAPNYRLRRQVQEPTTTSTVDSDNELEGTVNLLADALLGIVERQLNSKLDCDKVEDATQCTIQPGPKGEKGDIGRVGLRGPVGPTGEKGYRGNRGYTGVKGQKGQIGQYGQKGQKGQKGWTGARGYTGSQGRTGPPGPALQLHQRSCTWRFTDRCGHNCGREVLKQVWCAAGEYVAGFGIRTWADRGRYDQWRSQGRAW